MAANLTRLPFIRGPCIMSYEKERTQDTFADTFHSNIAFTTRNVVTTAHDCIANIGIRLGTDISKKQIKLSNLKQP